MTPEELLAKHGIKLESTTPGRHYTICPECSAKRSSAEHRATKVLGVTIDSKGVCWGCSHCGWTGPPKGSGGKREELQSYIYRDASGKTLFRKLRAHDKDGKKFFWLEQPDGRGGWKK